MKVALITGISGQDGSYLAELLLEQGYYIYGIIRRNSQFNNTRIEHIFNHERLKLRYGDLTDNPSLFHTLNEIKTRHYEEMERLEIYNLGAMSHVKVSFEVPSYTAQVDALGVLNLLEVIRSLGMENKTRLLQASSSEMYGEVLETPQNERTPFNPRSPYAISKLYSHYIVKNYREAYKMFCCSSIAFNHESPRRGPTFVTRKITLGLNKILKGEMKQLLLGNLDAKRDWSHAKDVVKALWMILQADKPFDYVISSNETHSVREFVERAFRLRDIEIGWKGQGLNEIGYDKNTGKELIAISEKYYRPTEVNLLLGDSSLIRKDLGWVPQYNFEQLVQDMVDSDCPK